MNRRERRKHDSKVRSHNRLICMGCERPMLDRTKEHVFPVWLIERTRSTAVKLGDENGMKWIGPNANTVPLCRKCNEALGTGLETPVKEAFEDAEAGLGLSDRQAELIVRWLWKYEAWNWCINHASRMNYDSRVTPTERLLGTGFAEMRARITFSVTRCKGDEYIGASGENRGLPMGIDTPPGTYDATCELGVFSRLAIGVSLRWADKMLPPQLTKYHFPELRNVEDRDAKVIFADEGFDGFTEAIEAMTEYGGKIKFQHEVIAKAAADGNLRPAYQGILQPPRKRLHLPPNYL